MIGEGGADVITKPVDFKVAPEVLEQRNFTPLPDFGKPDITEPPKYEEPSMTAPPDMSDMPPELQKVMKDIQAEAIKGKGQAEVLPEVKTEKPQSFLAKIVEWIKNFFRNSITILTRS